MQRRESDHPISGLIRGASDVTRTVLGAAVGAAGSLASGAWRVGGAIASAMRDAAHDTIDAAYEIGSDLAGAGRRLVRGEPEAVPRRVPVRTRR